MSHLKCKVILLGDGGVGKTSLLRRYVLDQFSDEYLHTVGAKVTKKTVNISTGTGPVSRLNMMIWDIPGQWDPARKSFLSFKKLQPNRQYFIGARAGIAVCDMTRRETLENMRPWVDALFGEAGTVPVVFIANKMDLSDRYEFSVDEARAVAERYSSPLYVASAKTSMNVETAFLKTAELTFRVMSS